MRYTLKTQIDDIDRYLGYYSYRDNISDFYFGLVNFSDCFRFKEKHEAEEAISKIKSNQFVKFTHEIYVVEFDEDMVCIMES